MAITPRPRPRFSGYQITGADDLGRIRSRYKTPSLTNEIGLNSDSSDSDVNSAIAREAYGLPPLSRAPVASPTGAMGDPGSADSSAPSAPSIIDTAPRAVMPAGGGTPPQGNAAQRWQPNAQPEWMAMGGSQRTFNRANVAAGVRPAIDARSNPSALNSTASDEIRAGWAQKNPSWNNNPSLPY